MYDLKTALENMGYRLSDCGDSWRTSALYRGGKNSTSVLIYKNTGIWYDYGQGLGPLPYKKLVELTADEEDVEKYLVELSEFSKQTQNEFIEMSKIYDSSILKNLLPSYKMYLDKGISEECLKEYQCGFAGGGKLYRRIVFPIYNQLGQIHGFSGRKVDNQTDAPKWKHIGKRREWIYPCCLPNFSTENGEDIILCESIGDSMALSENGFKDRHIVLFGLTPSSAVIGHLISVNPKRIIIATNNDLDSEINRGKVAALKAYLSLSAVFDSEKLSIKLPLANDFGDMHEAGMDFDKWANSADQSKGILKEASELIKHPKLKFTIAQKRALTQLNYG